MRFLRSTTGFALLATLVVAGSLTIMAHAEAANSVPRRMMFNSRLLNNSGQAITTAHKARFTFWFGADAVPSDLTGTGAINYSAPNFVGWKEEQTFTPNSNGNFYLEMGAINPLPSFASLAPATLSNLFMQVEVKPSSSADSAYEILDPRPLDSTIDRSPVLSVPFALNADRLDQRDVGTGSGSIPLLLSGGLLPVANMGGGTNRDAFTIDANNTSSSEVSLNFGSTLNKKLSYDKVNGWFVFNDDLRVEGDLTVTGLINGVDITTLSGNAPLKASSGAGLQLNVSAGGYRLNGNTTQFSGTSSLAVQANASNYVFFTQTGGLQARTGGFPTNISFIPVAQVTTNGTGITAVTDNRVLQSDDREQSLLDVLHPGYPDAAYKADGSDNVGQLSVSHEDGTKRNYYQWISSRASLNDYDVVLRVTVPAKYVRWQAVPLKISYKTSTASADDNKLTVEVFDTAGNAVALGGSSSNLTSTSWTATELTFGPSAVWTPGQSFIIKLRMASKNANAVQIGDVELRSVELKAQ